MNGAAGRAGWSANKLYIQLLGSLQVLDAGRPLALGGRQQRAVLALLALNANRVVPVDELLAGIWGDRATDGSVNVLQVYVSRLRRLGLGTDGVTIHRQNPGYLLEADSASLDLLAFRDLVDQARRIRPVSAERAAETLRTALGLWRSDPLQEFAGLPFAAAETAGLGRERQATLSGRIAVDLSLGRSADVIPELETLTEQSPLAEDLHAQLALAHYRSGRQADALAIIRRIRGRLADELGVDPGRELQDLERAVLAHDPSLGGGRTPVLDTSDPDVDRTAEPGSSVTDDADWPAEPIPVQRVWHAPARNPHFTGREALLDRIFHRLEGQPDTVAVETVYGLGGVGKTHLAIEFAHRFADSYTVVWWINAEEPTFIPSQLARLNTELGLPARASADDLVAQVLGHLGRTGGWLLIFDNAARVGDVASYRPFGSGHILVTSRNPLWGEIGGRTGIDVLDRTESLAFLKSRMPALDEGIGSRLAAELGDLPLALAQAVAYLEATDIDPAEYLDQFSRRRSAFLARGDVLDYQGRLDTAWDMSLQRLAATCPPALTLLELSAFLAPEPIPLELFAGWADPVTDDDAGPIDPLDAVETAVGGAAALSLVRRQSASFQVHRLVQAVIRAHLTAEERIRVATRTAALLAGVLHGDPNDPSSWSTYRRLAPHVVALGTIAEQLPQARRLLLDTMVYLAGYGVPRASSRLARRVHEQWRVALGGDHPDTLAMSAFVVHSSIWACDPRGACELGSRSLPVARRELGDDHPLTLRLAGYLALALTGVADVAQARDLAFDTMERVRSAFPHEHPELLRITAYVTLALAWIGDPATTDLAEATHASARRVFGPDHPVTLLAAIEVVFGLLTAGDTEAIRTLGEDTVARSRAVLGDRHLITLGSAALLALGLVWHGDIDRAEELRRELLSVADVDMAPDHLITLTIAAATASIRAALGSSDPSTDDRPPVAELDTARRMPGPDHPITLALAAATAQLAQRAGQPGERLAIETATRARRQLGVAHPLARIPVPVGRAGTGFRAQPASAVPVASR